MKKNLSIFLLCGIMILGLTTGCGKETNSNTNNASSNNQQETNSNNQVEEKSALTKLKEKFDKNDFSDIAGTYELAKYDTSIYTGENFQQHNNFQVQKIVIDEKGNIYKDSENPNFPIDEIQVNDAFNQIILKNNSGDMLFIYPASYEYKDDREIPDSWNDNSKNRISANFREFTYNYSHLYYIQK